MKPTTLLCTLLLSMFFASVANCQAPFALPASEEGQPGEGKLRRYDGYVKTWARLRKQWSQQVERDRGAVVFLGDSITQGWGPKFRGQFDAVKVANRGISGDTTRGMLIRLDDVISLKPQAVVMLMGTNDLEVGLPPEMIARNFKKIVAKLKMHSATMPIIVCQVFPSSAKKKRPQEKIRKVNELFATAVRGDKQVIVVDTWSLYANEEGDADPKFFPDLLHLNSEGYAKWASAIKPVFATLGYIETEPDSFEVEDGFVSLFNGTDLSGWGFRPTPSRKRRGKPRPGAPVFVEIKSPESFTGKTNSSDGRYQVVNGRLVVTTPAEGRRIQQLWTTREFDRDFTLKLEFRATPNADSGVFIRKPQLQCRDYLVAGPYKQLKKYRPQEWNELVVVVKAGVASATCNGEALTDNMAVPASGPIGLEGDRGQMEYRRIRIRMND